MRSRDFVPEEADFLARARADLKSEDLPYPR
jgi:hypothetical protein